MNSASHQALNIAITGVTRGLGRAMVSEFVRLGHRVFGCARTGTEIAKLADAYPDQDFQQVDVASDQQVKAWAEGILGRYRSPDFVLNNAAVFNLKAPLWEVQDREFSQAIDTNIKGVVNVIRHFAPSMIARHTGVIVNFSSRWGTCVEKQMAPYCATKWAVEAITQALSAELRFSRIAAIALNPGVVRTGMLEKYMGSAYVANVGDFPTPDEWARIAVPFILGMSIEDTGKVLNVRTNRTEAEQTAFRQT